jgi:hypothetical protein
MDQYRRLIEWSSRAIVEPDEIIQDQTRRMQAAAGELRFETAGKIKVYIDSFAQVRAGPYRHLRPLRDFNFLSLQPGPRIGQAKVFLVTPGMIETIAGLPFAPEKPGDLLHLAQALAQERATNIVDSAAAERIGVVSHHLFQPKSSAGTFLPLESIEEAQITKAYRDLQKQKQPQETAEGEGVVKQLQAM